MESESGNLCDQMREAEHIFEVQSAVHPKKLGINGR